MQAPFQTSHCRISAFWACHKANAQLFAHSWTALDLAWGLGKSGSGLREYPIFRALCKKWSLFLGRMFRLLAVDLADRATSRPALPRPGPQGGLDHPMQLGASCAACGLDRHSLQHGRDVTGKIGGLCIGWQIAFRSCALQPLAYCGFARRTMGVASVRLASRLPSSRSVSASRARDCARRLSVGHASAAVEILPGSGFFPVRSPS